jgi:hypothetical protein
VFTTTTLTLTGSVRALELLSGDTDVAASKPEQVRVFSLIVGSTFTQSPTLCNPAKLKFQRAACSVLSGRQRLKLECLRASYWKKSISLFVTCTREKLLTLQGNLQFPC